MGVGKWESRMRPVWESRIERSRPGTSGTCEGLDLPYSVHVGLPRSSEKPEDSSEKLGHLCTKCPPPLSSGGETVPPGALLTKMWLFLP